MSIDPNLLEKILARKKKKKKTTKMIRNPHAGKKKEKTADQLRLIKQQKDADERRRLKREEELQRRRRGKIERKKERKAYRVAEQEKREELAMRDTFEDPDADEEYDPYAFGFGDEDSVKLRF